MSKDAVCRQLNLGSRRFALHERLTTVSFSSLLSPFVLAEMLRSAIVRRIGRAAVRRRRRSCRAAARRLRRCGLFAAAAVAVEQVLQPALAVGLAAFVADRIRRVWTSRLFIAGSSNSASSRPKSIGRPSSASRQHVVVNPPGGGRRESRPVRSRPRSAADSAGSSSTSSSRSRSQAGKSASRVGCRRPALSAVVAAHAAPAALGVALAPQRGQPAAQLLFRQMELAGDAAEHLLLRASSVGDEAPLAAGRIWASVASICSAACEARCVSVRVSNPLVTALNLCSSASTALAQAVAGTRRFHA